MLAYYVGGLKPKECPWLGYARALGLKNSDAFFRKFTKALQTRNAVELGSRHTDANRRLFAQFPYDRSSEKALEKAITKIAGQLPKHWRAWITKLVKKVDHDRERELEERAEQVLSTAEAMAMAEARK